MPLTEAVVAGARILHICSDFARQSIYGELVAHLEQTGLRQYTYVPVRTSAELASQPRDNPPVTQFRFAHILKPFHRLFFNAKIRRVYDDLTRNIDVRQVDLVHAHFLYSDGAVALRLHRATGTPYVVAVRNTDVNAFMRLRPDLLTQCCDIIEHARQVVFITPAYVGVVAARLPPATRTLLHSKKAIVPNGLARYWLDRAAAERAAQGPLRLLYVGDFSRNKNIANTLRAAALVMRDVPVELTLVGGGGDGEAEIERMLASGSFPFAKRLGRVGDRDQLARIYEQHDIFVMPSIRETFGLAYLEALSQGLPIVFTRGQGVDGYFEPGSIGEAVDCTNPADIALAITRLSQRLPAVRQQCAASARSFDWTKIAERYLTIYRAAIAQRTGER